MSLDHLKDPAIDLECAIEISAAAHRGQRHKAGEPFILHPLRVMNRCSTTPERIVAVLHDVVAKTDPRWMTCAGRVWPKTCSLQLTAMIRREGESYAEFVDRAARNLIARAIKIADLRNNLDMTRIADSKHSDEQQSRKYI